MSKSEHEIPQKNQKVISTKEARKLLGKKYALVPDEEIEDMIQVFTLIARAVTTPEFSSI